MASHSSTPCDRAELWLVVHPELKRTTPVRDVTDYFADLDDETPNAMTGK